MRLLIAGAAGQLGSMLQKKLSNVYDIIGIDLPELDISDLDNVEEHMREHLPDIVVNAAAFTNVDGCVSDFPLAYSVNALGPHNLALACAKFNAELVHISSNEVFPGGKSEGYTEWDTSEAINPYGMSKAAGEFYVRHALPAHYIVRTSWLFAPGGKNFIHTVLRWAREGRDLKVVTDEIANPTYVADLCDALASLMASRRYGTYHLTNSGICSRYDFARVALDAAGMADKPIARILSSEFQRASTPPLDCGLQNNAAAAIGITLRPWQEAVQEYVTQHILTETPS